MFQRPGAHVKLPPTSPEIFEARFRRFLKEMEGYERKQTFERTLDAFLDVYSAWKHTHSDGLKLRVVMLAFELHRLDPAFECTLQFQDAIA